MLTHPTGLFGRLYFGPEEALSPEIFTRPTSPINCISSRTWGAGLPHVGLCPIFLVLTSVDLCDRLSHRDDRSHRWHLDLWQSNPMREWPLHLQMSQIWPASSALDVNDAWAMSSLSLNSAVCCHYLGLFSANDSNVDAGILQVFRLAVKEFL